jgi:hypothetical protein
VWYKNQQNKILQIVSERNPTLRERFARIFFAGVPEEAF